MKIRKLILPMMAFICAIGMAFANVNFNENPSNDYIVVNGDTIEIDEMDCGIGSETCQVQLERNGPLYPVFDDANLSTPKNGDGTVIKLY
ncbi:DUF6520 family protein [Christiangramia sp. SM2212]|uniref:DUF6520 family protein n=1 Tax=Christiangramia sediminicola TaxID=3073267 RepID=A0ABU1ERX2_9FLAO|nr:DUF6520 family protein [Christiangramia sp. SM2212]MDR5591142.1 DUF6520 family protein [Christiangramia sp. SM2212]